MIELAPGVRIRDDELQFVATRSGGPGGQNVNKVASRVELWWDVARSPSLDESRRQRLLAALANRIDGSGRVRIVAARERSQARNRVLALERLQRLVQDALRPRRPRRPTRPTAGSRRRRLASKRSRAEIKKQRRPPREDGA
jgi:ribosome-associated protein